MNIKENKLIKSESGNINLLFVFCFIFIIAFLGLALDIGVYNARRSALQNQCNVLRQNRFTYQEIIKNSDNPAKDYYNIIKSTLKQNNFKGTLTVYYKEDSYPDDGKTRTYKVRVILSENFDFTLLKIFGVNIKKISAFVDGGETYGGENNEVIWHPVKQVGYFNGKYTGIIKGMNDTSSDSDYTYIQSVEYPSEWG